MTESFALPLVLLTLLLFALPIAAVALLAWWTRWLARAPGVPRHVKWVARGLTLVSGALVVWGYASGAGAIFTARHHEGAVRARALAMGISEAMNDGAFALLVALVAVIWLAVFTWRFRRDARRRVAIGLASAAVLLITLTGVSRLLGCGASTHGDTAEVFRTIGKLRGAQEAYRAKTGHYANVSAGLAANAATNYAALYPLLGTKPGKDAIPWGAPCTDAACNPGMDWSMLPVHVDAPQKFGFSTIAGRAGERPTAVVTIQGKPLDWPVPEKDWYIISAVGDPDGKGVTTTLVATSWETDVHIDVSSGAR